MSKILLISPHFDDIAYSLGGFMLTNRDLELEVVTCFSVSNYCPCLDYDHVEDISRIRFEEEKRYVAQLGCGLTILGFKEALLRNYTLSTIFSSAVDDFALTSEIYRAIKKEIIRNDTKIVFCPMGIGKHIDHLIVKKAVLNIVREDSRILLNFYEDLPYCGFLQQQEYEYLINKKANVLKMAHTPKGSWIYKKIELLRGYSSQVTNEDITSVTYHYNRIKGERYWSCQ